MNPEFEEKALEQRTEASKWLFSIQSGICAVMWGPMGSMLEVFPLAGLLMALAWIGFASSALASVLIMLVLPQATEALPAPAQYAPIKRRLQWLLGLQLALFIAGAVSICLAALLKTAAGLLF